MMRRSPIARRSRLARTGALPKVNRRRKRSEFARCYGSRARVRFVAQLPCAACGYAGAIPRDNAHTENDGAGRKGDAATIIALCSGPNGCHRRQHQSGWLAIGMTGESRERMARLTDEAWQAHQGGAHP